MGACKNFVLWYTNIKFIVGGILLAGDGDDPYLGIAFLVLGAIFIVLFATELQQDAQSTVPSDVYFLKNQTMRLMGSVEVDASCGKYVYVGRRDDGTIASFCTDQNVPEPVFKITDNKDKRFVPYAPYGLPSQ